MATPTGFKIGEIKPANPEGYIEGGAKIEIYKRLFKEVYGKKNPGLTVEPMDLAPPSPMPFLEPASLTCTQLLIVGPAVGGVYGYLCETPFSGALRRMCRCKGDKDPIQVPVPAPEKEKGKEKVPKDDKVPDGEVQRPDVVVPVAVTLLAAAAAWAARKAGGRILAPATVIAAIVLIASGAEASVGLEGDDALEAMFKMSEAKGTPLPPDLQEAIRKDPALAKILTDAARSGDMNAARQKLGEQFTRVLVENRDQFTDDELRELLEMSRRNQAGIPNGAVNVDVLRRALAKRATATSGTGGGGSGSPGPKGAPGTPDAPAPPGERAPGGTTEAAKELPAPSRALFEAMLTKARKGPRVDPEGRERLAAAIRAISPPLTEAEAGVLIGQLREAQGKTVDEIIASVGAAAAALRTPPKAAGADGSSSTASEGTGGAGAGTLGDGSATKPGGGIATGDAVVAEKPTQKKDPKFAATLESLFGSIPPGSTNVFGDPKQVFVAGKPFPGVLAGRDSAGNLFYGKVPVTPRRVSGGWMLDVPGGILLVGATGRYGTTLKASYSAFPGVGEPK